MRRCFVRGRSSLQSHGSWPGLWLIGGGLVVALLWISAGLAADETVEPEVEAPRAPSVVVTAREDLPETFRKENPASVADLEAMEQHVQELLDRVSPAVVAVRVWASSGSGVVISEDGLVLSAAHVMDEPNREARFTFPDGRTVRGITLGTNHGMDAGLMKITEEGPWPYVEIADVSRMELGDWVLALGHPGGFERERAIVARFGRVIRLSSLGLQTDCTLTGGDSGGPLFDMHGRVVGIHSRVSNSTAGNFHVPVSTYVDTWERLAGGENWGSERRVYFGAFGLDDPEGVRLDRVIEDGPAFHAGLKEGDIIMAVNDQKIKDYAAFLDYLGEASPGDEWAVWVKRGERELAVSVTLERPRRRGWRP
jgi:serine protease Do